MCPALRGSTVSYAGDAHFPKHSLEYSLNFWSQSKKKNRTGYYSTTHHNTAPTAAQESLTPSLPPSLPPLPPSLPPYHFPACVVEVREGMPVFLFQV